MLLTMHILIDRLGSEKNGKVRGEYGQRRMEARRRRVEGPRRNLVVENCASEHRRRGDEEEGEERSRARRRVRLKRRSFRREDVD